MKLVLIESPGKREKWQKYLGSGFRVMASMGHVVELAKDGEDALGFDLEGDRIDCRFVPRGDRGKKVIRELKEAVKSATEVLFATDPDREGEIISWHLARELKVKHPTRIITSEITAAAVKKAIATPRPLDRNLVNSALGRVCLDKLVGFRGSPLVWSLNNGAKSVGRVQSATLHLICKREREIKVFVPEDYWSVYVDYAEGFRAFYAGQSDRNDEPEVEETDDTQSPNASKVTEGTRVKTQELADQLVAIAKTHPHQIVSVESKVTFKQPPAAFITSSLQQAAGSRLKFNPEHTMRVAQKLYEGGYITYMRTDSSVLSEDFCAAVRQYLMENDPENVPNKVAKHKKAALSQEAHEAIRPTEVTRLPSEIKREVPEEEAKLYDLIWRRAVASQCQSARILKTKVLTKSGSAIWKALGQILQFEGYLRYWRDIGEDQVLPSLQDGQPLTCTNAAADKKQTVPPPRYSESKLIQLMEKQGIGRPSTYSPTVKTLKERDYVTLTKGVLVPTQLGMEVDDFLIKALPDLISADFTAKMERELDAIAAGKLNWEKYLTDWNRDYFTPAIVQAKQLVKTNPTSQISTKITTQITEFVCPNCGKQMVKVPSKSTKLKADHFLSCDARHSGCGAVMFMNVRSGNYELPYSKLPAPSSNSTTASTSKHSTRKSNPTTASTSKSPVRKSQSATTANTSDATEMPCPVCGSPLEKFGYTDKKTGEPKTMLRCSDANNRRSSCKDVAFWWTVKESWWSKVYGELGKDKAGKTKKLASKKRSPTKRK